MQPWRLLADPSGYIFAWLVGYSGGLGAIAGVLITDYWILHNKRLKLVDFIARTASIPMWVVGIGERLSPRLSVADWPGLGW